MWVARVRPFEVFGRFDLRTTENVIRKRVDQAVDNEYIAARQPTVDCRRTDGAGKIEIARD